jgi:probable F420-dependent oxidoreductase
MATAAAATSTLKVAPLVLACDFRHPAVLARELASIDVLSGGRLEVGLGAGYNPLDYSRSGIPMDAPAVRVARLMEHTLVLRALFAEGATNFVGEHYRITELDGTPKPTTPAAQHADIVGVNPSTRAGRDSVETARDALPGSIDAKFALIRAAAPDRVDSLEFNAWLSFAHLTDDAAGLAGAMAGQFGAPVDEILDSPIMLIGSLDECAERLERRRQRWGYSYIVLPQGAAHEFAPLVERLTGT